MTSDDARVERCLGGDPSAFEEIVDAYQTALFNVALRMLRDREDAKDATENAFVSAWRNLARYERGERFAAWLHRILRNEVLSRLRRRRPTAELDETHPDPGPWADEGAERGEMTELLDGALQELTPELREVVVMRHWLDLSYEEIAERIGLPAKTVKSRLFTARRRLGESLRRRGVHS